MQLSIPHNFFLFLTVGTWNTHYNVMSNVFKSEVELQKNALEKAESVI